LPAIAVCQLQMLCLIHRIREQARSHIGPSAFQSARLLIALRNATNHFTSSCGSIGFTSFIARSLEKKQLSCDPKTIAATGQTRESGGYLFG